MTLAVAAALLAAVALRDGAWLMMEGNSPQHGPMKLCFKSIEPAELEERLRALP
jgi:hypothetical protein